jgi:uncharacterized protein
LQKVCVGSESVTGGRVGKIDPNTLIHVEVAYALSDCQWLITLDLPDGTTLAEAIIRSGLCRELPDLDPQRALAGVFGVLAGADTVLRDGDRVEIYRPLLADPKEIRRRRALKTRRNRRPSPG